MAIGCRWLYNHNIADSYFWLSLLEGLKFSLRMSAVSDSTVRAHSSDGGLIEYREFLDDSCSNNSSTPISLLENMPGNFQVTVSKEG